VANDVSIWDWTYRTTREWLQGRNFEARAPFKPHLVTPDEVPAAAAFGSWVDGEVMWSATIADLLFGPAELVA
jgi:2-keto-4-pentenoate hydratase/2-oxohepta-3-ene-1,7-dioic acid hydratase in catechol pathway